MPAAIRTDIHRPGHPGFNPGDYRYMAAYYQGSSDAARDEYRDEHARLAMIRQQFPAFQGNHAYKGTCDHCGAFHAYGVVFLHEPSEELVAVGHICADGTFDLPDRVAFLRRNAERAIAAERERRQLAEATAAFEADHPEILAHLRDFAADGNEFYADLLRKLPRYGFLTPGQIAAVERNMAKDHARRADRAAREAERAAEIVVPVACGDGIEICGVIVSTKWHEDGFGGKLVMTVRDDRGFRVWGSVPRAISDAEAGDHITFVANITASDRDPGFGFFKRPRRAAVLTAA